MRVAGNAVGLKSDNGEDESGERSDTPTAAEMPLNFLSGIFFILKYAIVTLFNLIISSLLSYTFYKIIANSAIGTTFW
jgi:hypothetical protein